MGIEYMNPLYWVGSSKKDLKEMPDEIKDTFGFALFFAQQGQKHAHAKPLKGFGSAGVLEVVESDQGGTYRAVYTVRFKEAVYVLHCFQKKSITGITTPKEEINLIKNEAKTGGGPRQGDWP
jgi:phage-related protein